jgi:hypothetical protein
MVKQPQPHCSNPRPLRKELARGKRKKTLTPFPPTMKTAAALNLNPTNQKDVTVALERLTIS